MENSTHLLHDLFNDRAELFGDHPAVVASNMRMSYHSLFQKANQLAHYLRGRGALPNSLIAIVMEKGWEQVVACLGILNAGSAYLPVDASFPPHRLEELLVIGEVSFILTQQRFLDILNSLPYVQKLSQANIIAIDDEKSSFSSFPVVRLKSIQSPDDLAYVIFTSGSTGRPKGVMIEHRAVVNTILDINERYQVRSEDKILALSNLNFDLSVYDIFGILAAGGTIVLPEYSFTKNPFHWIDLLLQEKITIWNTVPMFMQMLVEGLDEPLLCNLRLVLLSGDWIPLDLPHKMRSLISSSLRLISLGGATEASIWSITHEIGANENFTKSIPYGRPMLNQTFYVLNEEMEICPDEVVGELYIGGIGLSRGYWRSPEGTKRSFLSHPQFGRLYKTGDLGRYLPSNEIEFLGRNDFQVKINGYRIELQEIEYQLTRHSGVAKAAVCADAGASPNKHLVAYIVPVEFLSVGAQASGEAIPPEKTEPLQKELVNYLNDHLPKYMVPTTFIMINKLPLSSNGKVDRQALSKLAHNADDD
jgi:pyochelin synthetase